MKSRVFLLDNRFAYLDGDFDVLNQAAFLIHEWIVDPAVTKAGWWHVRSCRFDRLKCAFELYQDVAAWGPNEEPVIIALPEDFIDMTGDLTLEDYAAEAIAALRQADVVDVSPFAENLGVPQDVREVVEQLGVYLQLPESKLKKAVA